MVELATELERQAETKRDYLADTRELVMLNGSELVMTAGPEQRREFGITPWAHKQIASHLTIPHPYYERLRTSYPTLLDENVNRLHREDPEIVKRPRMLRTLDGNVRAYLSNSYRRLDYDDLLRAILPTLGDIDAGIQFESMQVTDSRLYIKAFSPRLEAEVKKGDIVRAGICISDSEVGQGSLAVQSMILRLVCVNGMIGEDLISRRHTGKRLAVDEDDPNRAVFKDDTLKASDEAFWLEVRDLVAAAFTEARFQQTVRNLQLAGETEPIQAPTFGVQELGRRFGIGEGEQQSILQWLTTGGDLTKYGLIQAVTRTAEDVDSYDRATELEEIGGKVLVLPDSEWRTIADAKELVEVGRGRRK